MAWHIGVDEAGYGPNLGPLVMTAVACQGADLTEKTNLWRFLQEAVRRPHEPADGRFLIEDSKLVYSSEKGLADLETSVLSTLLGGFGVDILGGSSLETLIRNVSGPNELSLEPWFHGSTLLPVAADPLQIQSAARRFWEVSHARSLSWPKVRCVIVCPDRFNQVVDLHGTKGAILQLGLIELLRGHLQTGDREPMHVTIDKHGGRNFYSAVLQNAFEDGMVLAREETSRRSLYEVVGLERKVHITFKPRADAEDFCVALASMISKYLRETLMMEFNGFWRREVPGLRPTAGYPLDARRFFEEILPAMKRLGLEKARVWRSR